jgi:hypothetical protein
VEAETDRWVPLDLVEKRQVGALVNVLEHVVEISHRLVRMDQQNEMYLRQGWAPAAGDITAGRGLGYLRNSVRQRVAAASAVATSRAGLWYYAEFCK